MSAREFGHHLPFRTNNFPDKSPDKDSSNVTNYVASRLPVRPNLMSNLQPLSYYLAFSNLNRKSETTTMSENAAGDNTEKDRDKKWETAFTARMRQIVPGFFPGNVDASYKWKMLQESRINGIVSLTDTRGYGGTLLLENQAFQNIVTKWFSAQIRRRETSLLI